MQTISRKLSQIDNFRVFLKTLEPTGTIYPNAFNNALAKGLGKPVALPPNYDLGNCTGKIKPNTLVRLPISAGHGNGNALINQASVVYERVPLLNLKNSLPDYTVDIALGSNANFDSMVKAIKESLGLTSGDVRVSMDPNLVVDYTQPFTTRVFISIPADDYVYLTGQLDFTVVNHAVTIPGTGGNGESAYELWLKEGNSGSVVDFLESLKGDTGPQGLSAYEVWLSYGNVGDTNTFFESLRGPIGERGYRGPPGVRGQDGPAGLPGAKGADGKPGKSAYEIWIALGNNGTNEQFIASLQGQDGKDGKSAYAVWLSLGNTGTEEDFINSLKGKDGYSTYQVWLQAGNNGTQQDFLDSLKGEAGLSAYEQSVANGFQGTFEEWLLANPMSLELVPIYDANNIFLGNVIGGAPGGGALIPGQSGLWVQQSVIDELKLKHNITENTDSIYGLISLLLTVVNKL